MGVKNRRKSRTNFQSIHYYFTHGPKNNRGDMMAPPFVARQWCALSLVGSCGSFRFAKFDSRMDKQLEILHTHKHARHIWSRNGVTFLATKATMPRLFTGKRILSLTIVRFLHFWFLSVWLRVGVLDCGYQPYWLQVWSDCISWNRETKVKIKWQMAGVNKLIKLGVAAF